MDVVPPTVVAVRPGSALEARATFAAFARGRRVVSGVEVRRAWSGRRAGIPEIRSTADAGRPRRPPPPALAVAGADARAGAPEAVPLADAPAVDRRVPGITLRDRPVVLGAGRVKSGENDHVDNEPLAAVGPLIGLTKGAQAIRRVAPFGQRTDGAATAWMTPPHGLCSRAMPLLAGWRPAEFAGGCPVMPRIP